MTTEDRFGAVVSALSGTAGVSVPDHGSGFGSATLRHQGRIFAMVAADRLVVKLPRARVDGLVASGEGVRFDTKGTPMKEWFSLDPGSRLDWLALAREALAFAGHRS